MKILTSIFRYNIRKDSINIFDNYFAKYIRTLRAELFCFLFIVQTLHIHTFFLNPIIWYNFNQNY